MLDPKLLRSDLPGVAAALARRGFLLDVEAFASLEEQRKSVQIEVDRLRAERNANAKAVGFAKSKGEDVGALLKSGESLNAELQSLDQRLRFTRRGVQVVEAGVCIRTQDPAISGQMPGRVLTAPVARVVEDCGWRRRSGKWSVITDVSP